MTQQKQLSYKKIINASANGVIVTNADSRIFFINRQAEKILALDPKTVEGAPITDILPLMGPPVLKCLKSGKPQIARSVSGKDVSLIASITQIREDDEVQGAVCTFQKITALEPAMQDF